jgi:peptide/nickel transport system ATP-binding protein
MTDAVRVVEDPRDGKAVTGPLLAVEDLRVEFRSMRGLVKALIGVSLQVDRGEVLGLVGESGCGKTVTGLAVLGLLPRRQSHVEASLLRYDGLDLLALRESERQALRGTRMAMVFQDPLASLNPVFTVGDQLRDVIRVHRGLGRRAAADAAREALGAVGLAVDRSVLSEYPHRLSGGMRQRVCIAMALACGAELLIADEPTTALDVTIQAQILDLLLELRGSRGLSILLVTHNLGVAAQVCDRVAVMYAGAVVESGDTRQVLQSSQHPYTIALGRCLPQGRRAADMESIPGAVPDLIDPPAGCRFHPRCSLAVELCSLERPPDESIATGHVVACHRWREVTPTCCTVPA